MVCSINFMTSPNILYILRLSIIHVCGTISYVFLLSITLSLKMCWSLIRISPVSLVPFHTPFYSSGNSPQLISKSKSSLWFVPLIFSTSTFSTLLVFSCWEQFFYNRFIFVIMFRLESFSHQLMVFHWNLSDSESPQVSRILLSTLTSLKRKYLTLLSIIPFVLYTIDKIKLSFLNVSLNWTPRLHSSLIFWFPCCLIFIYFLIKYLLLYIFLYKISI